MLLPACLWFVCEQGSEASGSRIQVSDSISKVGQAGHAGSWKGAATHTGG